MEAEGLKAQCRRGQDSSRDLLHLRDADLQPLGRKQSPPALPHHAPLRCLPPAPLPRARSPGWAGSAADPRRARAEHSRDPRSPPSPTVRRQSHLDEGLIGFLAQAVHGGRVAAAAGRGSERSGDSGRRGRPMHAHCPRGRGGPGGESPGKGERQGVLAWAGQPRKLGGVPENRVRD